jgi:hypothetical protein
MDIKGNTIANQQILANTFNDYFLTIADNSVMYLCYAGHPSPASIDVTSAATATVTGQSTLRPPPPR